MDLHMPCWYTRAAWCMGLRSLGPGFAMTGELYSSFLAYNILDRSLEVVETHHTLIYRDWDGDWSNRC